MQRCSLLSEEGYTGFPPARHACCKPCCGYILEEIHSLRQEVCCFQGRLNVCGLPSGLAAPLKLCSATVVCIAPQRAQNRNTFCLTLCCEVADCCGCRACGEASVIVALRHAPGRCDENLRLGARIEVENARFCPPSAFEVFARIRMAVVTSGAGRMLRRQDCASDCVFPPLYPAPVRD